MTSERWSTYQRLCSWCDKPRGFLPSARAVADGEAMARIRACCAAGIVLPYLGVLICPRCDHDHAQASVIPRERYVMDLAEYRGTP
jgi:hypothetical protein